jgi:hypothetical protein
MKNPLKMYVKNILIFFHKFPFKFLNIVEENGYLWALSNLFRNIKHFSKLLNMDGN